MCPWIGLDFGFEKIHGFGFGLGFVFRYGFKSKSENPNPHISTAGMCFFGVNENYCYLLFNYLSVIITVTVIVIGQSIFIYCQITTKSQ